MVVVTVFSLLAAVGCGDPPEQRLRDRIEEARIAAEAGDIQGLGEMLAEDYADDHGNDRATVVGMVGYYVRVEGGLHIWVRVDEMEITEPRKAQVRLLVALAAGPIEKPQDLVQLRAEVHRFTLTMVEADPGDWLLRQASWERASVADVL